LDAREGGRLSKKIIGRGWGERGRIDSGGQFH